MKTVDVGQCGVLHLCVWHRTARTWRRCTRPITHSHASNRYGPCSHRGLIHFTSAPQYLLSLDSPLPAPTKRNRLPNPSLSQFAAQNSPASQFTSTVDCLSSPGLPAYHPPMLIFPATRLYAASQHSLWVFFYKPSFHDTDIVARILADTSDTRNFLKSFLCRQAERGSRPTRRHPRHDPRDDVDVGVVECGLYQRCSACRRRIRFQFDRCSNCD